MRAVRYHEHGGPEVLAVEEVPTPEPAKGEVMVEVRATSANRIDTLLRWGYEPFDPDLPITPGSDLAGVVESVGEGVDAFEPGDRVLASGFAHMQRGTAEYATVPVDLVASLPAELSFAEGTCLGHVGITAWHSLINYAEIEPTETLLVHGGSGGVGHIAVQIAARIGAHVIATSSSAERRSAVSDLGADATIDYTRSDLKEAIVEAAGGDVDVILDGNLDDYLALDFELLGRNGRIIGMEFTADEDGVASISEVHARMGNWNEASLQFVGTPHAPDISGTLSKLATLAAWGDLDVRVARTYPLESAADAHRDLEAGGFVGKLVVTP